MKKNKKLIIIVAIAVLICIAIGLLLIFNKKDNETSNNKEYIYYSYDTKLGDHYYNKAEMVDGVVSVVYTTVTYKSESAEELEKIVKYEYDNYINNSDIYKDVVINDDNTISFTSLKDISYNKNKEEIERSFTSSKIHFNFKWEE